MRLILFVFFLFMIPNPAASQTPLEKALDLQTKTKFLEKFSSKTVEIYERNMAEALRLAPEKGWVIYEVMPDGQVVALQGIDEGGQPVYYITHNISAAATISTDKVWPGGNTGFNLSASSGFLTGKIGMWDGGRVRTTHQEYAGRVQLMDNPSSLSAHSTHVAGTLIATGVNPLSKGMSFEAQQLKAWDFSNDVSEMAAAASDLLISNHSYGAIAGWRYNSSRSGTPTNPYWEWWGDPAISTYEDYKFGYYNAKARDWDLIAYNAPYYLIVKSAGNDRNTNGPSIGQPYWQRTSGGSWQLVPARIEGAISDNDSYDILSAYANAKNILLLGAVNTIPGGYTSPADVVMSNFSSWGPTDDGRIKPDVVANGVSLLSAGSTSDVAYRTTSGTSMAAPNASGSMLLLQEHYYQINSEFMLSSTLRGLVCHTAGVAGNEGPDYSYGWGLINIEKAAQVIANINGSHLIEEIVISEGDTILREFVAHASGQLMATICWTDPEGTPHAYGPEMLNNRTPMLVNDLDLRIIDDTITHKPWILDVENPSAPAVNGDNLVDNIEQVVLTNPVPGRTYTVMITHKGSLQDSLQVFSLVASGIGTVPVCPSYAEDDRDSRIDGFVLHTINNITDSGCHTYRDFTNLASTLNLGPTYPFTVMAGTCGQENNRMIKIFADWNSDNVFGEDELVATSGVISVSGPFEGFMTIPDWVQPGYTGRLRIVLSEISDPDEISSCGPYAAGETQDYLLHFGHPLFDAGIEGIIYPPDELICSSEEEWVEIKIKNYGLNVLTGIQLSAQIYENGHINKIMEQAYTDSLAPFQTDLVQFNSVFLTKPGKDYLIVCSVQADIDLNSSNDTLFFNFSTAQYQEPPGAASAFMCEGSELLTLSATSTGTIFWYDAAENGSLAGVGDNTITTIIPDGNKFYAGANTLADSIGPLTKDSEPFTNGSYHQATATPFITTYVPLVIRSATLYAGWPGKVTFWIEDADSNEMISQKTLRVKATRNPPSQETGATNDPGDTGSQYLLNLAIPEPGDYRIHVSYDDGATLYRNNASASNPYPYIIPGVISINGNSAALPSAFYYWLYNIKLESYGCRSELLEVPIVEHENPVVEILSITNQDSTVTLNAGNPGSFYLWGTGETTQSITVNQSGIYSVEVTNPWGCSASDSVEVVILGIRDLMLPPAKVYPNPSRDYVIVESTADVMIEIYNLSGITVFREIVPRKKHLISVASLPPSLYLVKLHEPDTGRFRLYKVGVK